MARTSCSRSRWRGTGCWENWSTATAATSTSCAGLLDNTYYKNYPLEYSRLHTGNSYPTHGLGPICQYMGINRGDRFERVVSLESAEFGLTAYIKEKFGDADPRGHVPYRTGDMNTSIVRTERGRTIMIQYGRYSPRPTRAST